MYEPHTSNSLVKVVVVFVSLFFFAHWLQFWLVWLYDLLSWSWALVCLLRSCRYS